MPDFSKIILGDENPSVETPVQEPTPVDGSKPDVTPIDAPVNPNPESQEQETPETYSIGDTTLENGMEIETPDGVMTFKDGTLVDKDGNVFKSATDIKDYLAQFGEENQNEFTLGALQSFVGVDVTGDDGNPISFTDDAEGRTAYLNKVFEIKQKEATDVALNTFFANNPTVKQFSDFIAAGGNPAQFGQIPDRTGVTFDEDNTEQHKSIIRIAWKENNQRGDVEKYIKYLEDSGSLADTAKEELQNIKDRDIANRKDIEERAAANARAEQEELATYWNNIKTKIDSGSIGQYKLPETIVKEVNGQKRSYNRNDFFNYISKTDPQTRQTQYQKDLAAMSDDDAMSRELLDAWMHFTGGTYQDIIKMAVKEEEVKRLKLVAKAAQKTPGTVHVVKPGNGKVNRKDIIL